MARTQATTYTSIWSDPDFVGLTAGAQRLYWLILTQGKLSLAGALDVHPRRWAKLAPDTTEADVVGQIAELVDGRFLVVDEDELIVRTFVAGDLARGTVNGNLIKGMWSAWAAISSPLLRKVVVDEMPAKVWDRDGVTRPSAAEELRSEPRLELPLEPGSEPTALCSLSSADCSGSPAPTVVAADHPGFAGPKPAVIDQIRGQLAAAPAPDPEEASA